MAHCSMDEILGANSEKSLTWCELKDLEYNIDSSQKLNNEDGSLLSKI